MLAINDGWYQAAAREKPEKYDNIIREPVAMIFVENILRCQFEDPPKIS